MDRTVCVVGAGRAEPFAEYRIERAHLVLAAEGAPAPAGALPFRLEPEPAEPLPDGARAAVFTTGGPPPAAVEALVASTNLARRAALADDLERARAERCDVYLVELKAAAIDTVAQAAQAHGARIVFLRNRPLGIDEALLELHSDAA